MRPTHGQIVDRSVFSRCWQHAQFGEVAHHVVRAAALALLAVAGCDASDGPNVEDGERYGHCYPNGTCNVGLHCSAGLCVPIDAGLPTDAPVDAPIDAPIDAGFVCSDDSQLEPNDTYMTAWVTPVDTAVASLALNSLALCPSGDKDHYAVAMSSPNKNLEIVVAYSAAGVPPYASILNSSGIALANASMTVPNTKRAYTPNLPTGTYYVQVGSQTPTTSLPDTRNNYSLTINVTGP